MTRMMAFVAALFMTAVAVSSACVASDVQPLRFTIEPSGGVSTVQVRFARDIERGRHEWSSSFRVTELAGLDPATLAAPATRPLRFAIAREAGRVDCAGSGGNRMAHGTCSVTADAKFNRYLSERGIRTPTADETFGLIALDVRRDLVAALAQARYPTPSISDLQALTAIGVKPAYIRSLAGQGYRPRTIDALVQFGALGITPEYIGSFSRAGYDLSAEELVQLKALDITPEFVRGFERIGYGRLPAETLLQLKALNVTPEFVRSVHNGGALPSPDRLVMLRALGGHDSRR